MRTTISAGKKRPARRQTATVWLNQAQAAAELGLDRSTLCHLSARYPQSLYAPAVRGLPGTTEGGRLVRYHQEQVRLIQAVLLGQMQIDEAFLRWDLFRRRFADSVRAATTSATGACA